MQSVELQATCAALGYIDGDTYRKEPDCLESVKDLIRFLKRDDETCSIRRQLGEAEILQTDLIPIIKQYKDETILLETVIRLMVNLTQPAKLCFQNHVPTDKTTLNFYLQVESHLQEYKEAFADEALFAIFTRKLGELLKLDWEHRQEEDRLLIERILLVIRNILHIPPDTAREMRTDDDASMHDQVMWALHVSGMEDMLLYLAGAENERQFSFHVLEIISLMFREQTSQQLAAAGVGRVAEDKAADEKVLASQLAWENSERRMKLMKTNSRRSMFNGTYTITNIKAISERALTFHRPLETLADNCVEFSHNKTRRKRPKNRRVQVDADIVRRSTLAIRLFLKEFCIQFIADCYNPLMRSVKDSLLRSRGEENDETYYFWAIRFFMEFNRVLNFRVELVSETMSVAMFHYIQTHVQTYHEMVMTNKKEGIVWSRRMHLALKSYYELLQTLHAMDMSSDPAVKDSAKVLKNNIFYTLEYREIFITLMRKFDDTRQSRSFLRDLICCIHLFLKMLEQFCKTHKHLVVQRKKKKVGKRRKKNAKSSGGGSGHGVVEMTTEDLDSRWDVVSGELSALLQGRETLPDSALPFDAASDVDMEQQRVDAVFRVQDGLRIGSAAQSLALFRAAREVWPDRQEFGRADISAEDEFMALREIYYAELPQKARARPAELHAQNQESDQDGGSLAGDEEDDEEERETFPDLVEQEFSFQEYIIKYAHPLIVKACTALLSTFDKNTAETNHCIIKLLHRIAFDCRSVALLFQISLFRIFLRAITDPPFTTPHYKELRDFSRHVVAKFFDCAKNNPKIYVELFFWKSQKEAYEVTEGYGSLDKVSKVKQLWTEDQDEELRHLYEQYNAQREPGVDIVDQIMSHMSDQTKSRRQVLRQLVMLNVIGSAKELNAKQSGVSRGPKFWREEEEEELTQLFERFKDAPDQVGEIVANMTVPRSRPKVIQKLLDLGLVSSKIELRKKRIKKNKNKSTKGGKKRGSESEDESEKSRDENGGSSSDDEPLSSRQRSPSSSARARSPSSSSSAPSEASDNEEPAYVLKIRRQAANSLQSGIPNTIIEWLRTRLSRTADSRDEDGNDLPIPLVPLTEEQDEAMESDQFKKLLIKCGLKEPSSAQEYYWRIPSNLSVNDIRSRIEALAAPKFTPLTRRNPDSTRPECSTARNHVSGSEQNAASTSSQSRNDETRHEKASRKYDALKALLKKRKTQNVAKEKAPETITEAVNEDDDKTNGIKNRNGEVKNKTKNRDGDERKKKGKKSVSDSAVGRQSSSKLEDEDSNQRDHARNAASSDDDDSRPLRRTKSSDDDDDDDNRPLRKTKPTTMLSSSDDEQNSHTKTNHRFRQVAESQSNPSSSQEQPRVQGSPTSSHESFSQDNQRAESQAGCSSSQGSVSQASRDSSQGSASQASRNCSQGSESQANRCGSQGSSAQASHKGSASHDDDDDNRPLRKTKPTAMLSSSDDEQNSHTETDHHFRPVEESHSNLSSSQEQPRVQGSPASSHGSFSQHNQHSASQAGRSSRQGSASQGSRNSSEGGSTQVSSVKGSQSQDMLSGKRRATDHKDMESDEECTSIHGEVKSPGSRESCSKLNASDSDNDGSSPPRGKPAKKRRYRIASSDDSD